jgi:tRNA(Ile)-lysidine synthase
MRQAGATTPSPREWAPSPAWPQGRDVFLLRPLLDLRRADLRAGLAEQGEDWIEDPANADPASARARARLVIAGEGVASHASPGPDAGPLPFRCGPAGELSAAPGALLDAPAPTFRLWIGTALACAAGDARAPRAVALDRLRARLDAGRPFGATLAGARMVFDGAVVVIAREAADPRADAPASIDLAPGEPTVWDGRFEATARTPGLRMASLRGRMARLASADRRLLRRVHPAARPALPVALNALGQIACPTLAAGAEPAVRPLIMARLAGACGAIHHERAMVAWRMDGDHPKFAA